VIRNLTFRSAGAARRFGLAALIAALVVASPPPAAPQGDAVPLVLTGSLTGADHETYRTLAFRVPAGVHALTIAFSYTGQAERTVIDLGVFDPEGLRGWSGGDKSAVVIGEASATPSYRAGPIQPGRWRLLLGVPNIRPESVATFEAKIWFHRDSEPPLAPAPLRDEPGWYRGDLHVHSGHSDGTCAAEAGERIACPVYRVLETARERGLDFIALTDHNTTSQFDELRALQPEFAPMLLLGGRELTTFQGHANIIGASQPIDFRIGAGRTMAAALREARPGFVMINHPSLPSGEQCMGCGWTAPASAARFAHAVEVVNGGAADALTKSADGPLSGMGFWHARLNEGRRLIGVAGSDNHDPGVPVDRFSAIGKPLTVVGAANLSQAAILAGLRNGHVFIDVEGTSERFMAMRAASAECTAEMGGVLACTGTQVSVTVDVTGVASPRVEFYWDGEKAQPYATRPDAEGRESALARYPMIAPSRHWVRADVRDGEGRLALIGNPIFINWR
jgi:hypothetical protein